MEASTAVKNTNSGEPETPEPEKKKSAPTKYHVLKRVDTTVAQAEGAGPTYERLTKSAIAASSTTQAIELALDGGEGNGTYVAVPERSFAEKTVKVEEVKTTKVSVG